MEHFKINEVRRRLHMVSIVLALFLLNFFYLGCSPENDSNPINGLEDIDLSDLKTEFDNETWQDQVDRLAQKVRRFHNFQVATAQGWDFDLTGYVPNMGHHFVNEELMDGTFELLRPEALIYIPDEDGNWEFVGVEYLVLMEEMEDPSTPPEGFIGDEDDWTIVGPFWTLHAWVGLENPDGVFNPTNSNVPSAP